MAALSAALLTADEEAWAASVEELSDAAQLEAKLDALKGALQQRCVQLQEKNTAARVAVDAQPIASPTGADTGAAAVEASPTKSGRISASTTPRGSPRVFNAPVDGAMAATPAEASKVTPGGPSEVVTPLTLSATPSPRPKLEAKPPSRPPSVREEKPDSARKRGELGSSDPTIAIATSSQSAGSGIALKTERSPSLTAVAPTPPVPSAGSTTSLTASGSGIARPERPPSVSFTPSLMPSPVAPPAPNLGAAVTPTPDLVACADASPSTAKAGGWAAAKPAGDMGGAGPKKGARFICIETYQAAGPEELSFTKGDSLAFWEADESGWAYGEVQGKRGWFPFSYVAPPDLAAAALAAELQAQSTPMPPALNTPSATATATAAPTPTPTPQASTGAGASANASASVGAHVSHTASVAPAAGTTASAGAPPTVETASIVANKNVISNKLSGFLGGKRTDKKSLEEKHILMDLSASQAGAAKEEKRSMLTNFFKMGGSGSGTSVADPHAKPHEEKEVKKEDKPSGTKRLLPLPVPGMSSDKKGDKDKKKGTGHDEPVAFGQALEKLLQKPDSKKSVRSGRGLTLSYIPAVVSDCIRFLDRPECLRLEGLFRLSPSKDDFDRIRALWKSMAEPLDLENHTQDPHAVAAVLKSFFNSLPEPVMTYDISEKIFALKEMEKLPVSELKALVAKLPILNKMTVECLFVFLRRVIEFSDKNRMTASNVAIVWGPNLVRAKVETPELLMSRQDTLFVECVLAHSLEIFPPTPHAMSSAHK